MSLQDQRGPAPFTQAKEQTVPFTDGRQGGCPGHSGHGQGQSSARALRCTPGSGLGGRGITSLWLVGVTFPLFNKKKKTQKPTKNRCFF